jgi:hypothetical protein
VAAVRQEIDWEAPAPKPGKPSDHIEMLIKETTQLHKILSKYLPESTVEVGLQTGRRSSDRPSEG